MEERARSSSAKANMPIMTGMNDTPPIRSTEPKVKRGWPEVTSKPMVAINRPINSETRPRTGVVVEISAEVIRPSSANQKNSKDENFIAISAR